MELAKQFIGDHPNYRLAVVHGNALEEADSIVAELKKILPDYEDFFEGQISPSLGVHTGPGLIGIGVQKINEINLI